ncbi:hypothetical protein RSSM_05911 [Rhodopirellula sallentina SM41]|uniref:Uncharacterized protein n=1 Tax=Rhodopirellula sallentina SM41 TaxID=1263870 RepID=M5U443_9BACT|nr:hypothetical protein RSSM_05911 [Rhodopirellula sallentina SM41]
MNGQNIFAQSSGHGKVKDLAQASRINNTLRMAFTKVNRPEAAQVVLGSCRDPDTRGR